MTEDNEEKGNQGILFGLGAYFLWGILPLYWKLLNTISAEEILAHRIFWSFIFVGCIVLWTRDYASLRKSLDNKKNIILIIACAILITINWFTYIWAVNTNQVVEASMGYYINPLVVVLLSIVVLKERFNLWQSLAIGLAAIGVLIMTIQYGKVPMIALTLALSFGFYGLLKKLVNVSSINGLFLETTVLTPIALGYIIFKQTSGTGAIGSISFSTLLILIGSGIATASPLLLFAMAAHRIKLSTLGLLQYLAPTISLFIGVVVFKEPFTAVHLVSFGFIWVALIFYSFSTLNKKRQSPELQPVTNVTK